MYEMWSPYGERLYPEGTIDLATISPAETLHIILGGGPKLAESIVGLHTTHNERFEELMFDAYSGSMEPQDHGLSAKFWDKIRKSHQAQQRNAESARAEHADTWPEIVQKAARAALGLTKEGVLTPEQAANFESRLLRKDGTPQIQYSPLSRLEYMRFMYELQHVLPGISEGPTVGSDETYFSLGAIVSAHTLHPYSKGLRAHNRMRQLVRASLSGLEVYDVTQDDGARLPQASVIGVESAEPSIVMAPMPYTKGKNAKIAEGVNSFISRKLLDADPSLGITLPNVRGPGDWAAKIAGLKEGYPLVYKAIMQATLRDATTAQDKRRAIMVMHEQADRLLGARSSLERIFSGTGTIYQALHASR
jgi:hypothetical protein